MNCDVHTASKASCKHSRKNYKTSKHPREKAARCAQLSTSMRSNGKHSLEQARAEAGELPEEDRPTWANTV